MHRAQITNWGEAPKYTEVEEPPPPNADEVRVKLLATGVHRVVRSRASGKHYTSGQLPHTPGVDGVGRTEDGGGNVYFSSFAVGSMSELLNMPKHAVTPLPHELEPTQVAALLNPAMSSWMALRTRVQDLPEHFSILILGATSASGRAAIHNARCLGAARVVGAARNESTLATLGLDEAVVVRERVEETDFSAATAAADVDVVLDYYGGPLTAHLLRSLRSTRPIQYVHVGGVSGNPDFELPTAALRSKNITIRGCGPGAWSVGELVAEMPALLEAMKKLPPQPVRVAKLADVEHEWSNGGSERLVLVP